MTTCNFLVGSAEELGRQNIGFTTYDRKPKTKVQYTAKKNFGHKKAPGPIGGAGAKSLNPAWGNRIEGSRSREGERGKRKGQRLHV